MAVDGNFTYPNEIGITTCSAGMHQTSRFLLFSSLLLILSAADLYLIGLGVWYRYTESTTKSEPAHAKPRTLDLILVSCS
jgi:hypothetical protein